MLFYVKLQVCLSVFILFCFLFIIYELTITIKGDERKLFYSFVVKKKFEKRAEQVIGIAGWSYEFSKKKEFRWFWNCPGHG